MIETIFILIMCHLIGDYVLQCDFIAKTKGENLYHLIVHTVLYLLPFYICFGFTGELVVLWVTHALIDALKANVKLINYWQDQVLHYLVLAIYLI